MPFEQTVYGRFSRLVNENKIERDDFCRLLFFLVRPVHIFITQEELA